MTTHDVHLRPEQRYAQFVSAPLEASQFWNKRYRDFCTRTTRLEHNSTNAKLVLARRVCSDALPSEIMHIITLPQDLVDAHSVCL